MNVTLLSVHFCSCFNVILINPSIIAFEIHYIYDAKILFYANTFPHENNQ